MPNRFDPFRELDRLSTQVFGPAARPAAVMPMDVYREADRLIAEFDMPGVEPASVDLTIDRNVMTVKAERAWAKTEGRDALISERAHGTFSRQLSLGENLDTEHVSAHYEHGVLTITIPVVEQAKPRKVEISTSGGAPELIETGSNN